MKRTPLPAEIQQLLSSSQTVQGQRYAIGTAITNSLGWHGWIVSAERSKWGVLLYRVWWQERASPPHGTDKTLARAWARSPVLTKPESEVVLRRES